MSPRNGSPPAATDIPDLAALQARDYHLQKGQSKRIWGELYKVLDSSDVIIQVGSYSSISHYDAL